MSKSQNRKRPSEVELQVLSVLWDGGEATARQVLDLLPDGKPRAYTTVLSTMQVMETKGLVSRRSHGRSHIWKADVSQDDVTRPLIRDLVRNVFSGRPAAVVQQLLGGDEPISDEELAEIRQLLDAHRNDQITPSKP